MQLKFQKLLNMFKDFIGFLISNDSLIVTERVLFNNKSKQLNIFQKQQHMNMRSKMK